MSLKLKLSNWIPDKNGISVVMLPLNTKADNCKVDERLPSRDAAVKKWAQQRSFKGHRH